MFTLSLKMARSKYPAARNKKAVLVKSSLTGIVAREEMAIPVS
jgi:hypothetical protein